VSSLTNISSSSVLSPLDAYLPTPFTALPIVSTSTFHAGNTLVLAKAELAAIRSDRRLLDTTLLREDEDDQVG
jgi:hypothetical protein